MSWKLQQLRSDGSENPAQVLSTARNAIRRVRMVMRGLPQRELTEEGTRLIGCIQHDASQDTKRARLRCADCSAAATWPTAVGLLATAPHCCCGPSQIVADHCFVLLLQRGPRADSQPADEPVPDAC